MVYSWRLFNITIPWDRAIHVTMSRHDMLQKYGAFHPADAACDHVKAVIKTWLASPYRDTIELNEFLDRTLGDWDGFAR